MHYILIYEVIDDYVERRQPYRAGHIAHAQRASEAGDLAIAGALDDPPDQAMFVFRGKNPHAPALFAEADPYVRHGLVKSWRIRKWNTVIGDGAQLPKLQ